MRLISQMELAVHVVVAIWILLDAILGSLVLRVLLLRLYLLQQVVMISQQLHRIYLANLLQRNIWCLVLETSMHVYLVLRRPAGVPESLD